MKRKMLKFFINNWLTVLLAFIPPLVITYYFQREVRQLDVVLKSNTPVVQIEERFSAGITVLYEKNRIQTLNVVELAVENTGNRPIEDDDFKQPLTFTFNGTVLPNPKLLDVGPKTLKPELKQMKPNILELQPLLLNQRDHFSFLAYLIDSKTPITPVDISARIYGIKEPRLLVEADYPVKGSMGSILIVSLSWIMVTVGVGVSLISLIALARRLKEVYLDFSASSSGVDIVFQPDETQSVAQRLARELNIVGQDYKANLLLLRIKIEEQLRELANKVDLPSRLKLKSPTSLTKRLADRGVLPGTIAGRIEDVMPVINRELHASDAYLVKEEFEDLQQFTVQLLSELIRLNEQQEPVYKQQDPEIWPDDADELGIIIDVIDEDDYVPVPPDFDNWYRILRKWEGKEVYSNGPKPSWETDPEARRRYILEKERERARTLGFPLKIPLKTIEDNTAT